MFRWIQIFLAGAFALGGSVASAEENLLKKAPALAFALDGPIEGARDSFYSSRVWLPLASWPPENLPLQWGENPVWMRPIKHPERDLYIGLVKRVRIDAPVEKVRQTIDTFSEYPKIFSDVRSATVVSQDHNKWTVSWVREAPVAVAPTVRMVSAYLVDDRTPGRVIYRYQVIESNSVETSDGLIVLESQPEGRTLLTAWDFFDVNWGMLGALFGSKIWRESLSGSYKGDIAFKARCEHPDWDVKRIEEFSEQMLAKFPVHLDDFDFWGIESLQGALPGQRLPR